MKLHKNKALFTVIFLTLIFVGFGVYKKDIWVDDIPKNKVIEEKCMSAEVVMYTTSVCPHCVRAKRLLQSKGVTITEIDVGNNHDMRLSMVEKSGGRSSVPQIFIGDTHVGGADELYALDGEGKLDSLLGKC